MLLWIKKKLEGFFSILGSGCDKIFEKNSILFGLACFFFEKTSRLTRFLLFDSIGYPLMIFLVGFFTNFFYDEYQILFLKLELFGFSKLFVILGSCSFGFQLFILVYFLFFYVVFINTVLASSTKISLYMKSKYGDLIMKELHYNSTVSTLLKSITPAVTTVCVFCGNRALQSYDTKIVIDTWGEVAQAAIEKGQQPPECPITLINHTTGSSNVGFDSSRKD